MHRYISFIHRNFTKEEENQYLVSDWNTVGQVLGIEIRALLRKEIIAEVRRHPDYMERLRELE